MPWFLHYHIGPVSKQQESSSSVGISRLLPLTTGSEYARDSIKTTAEVCLLASQGEPQNFISDHFEDNLDASSSLHSTSPHSEENPTPTPYILKGVELSDQVLGKGRYGSVFKATYNNTTVAARFSLEGNTCNSKQCQNEMETMSRIRHPNIVTLFGKYENYIIMEYLEGGSLHQLVHSLQSHQRMVSTPQKLSILCDISCALEHLHNDYNIVHQHLSSSNVLLTNNLIAKVSDIGMLCPLQPCSETPGCPSYRPPETLKPCSELTEKGNIYSFGIIAVELVNEEHTRLAKERKFDLQIFENNAPSVLLDLINSCLQHEPSKRPSAKVINLELQKILNCLSNDQSDLTKWAPGSEMCNSTFPFIVNSGGMHGSFMCTEQPALEELYEDSDLGEENEFEVTENDTVGEDIQTDENCEDDEIWEGNKAGESLEAEDGCDAGDNCEVGVDSEFVKSYEIEDDDEGYMNHRVEGCCQLGERYELGDIGKNAESREDCIILENHIVGDVDEAECKVDNVGETEDKSKVSDTIDRKKCAHLFHKENFNECTDFVCTKQLLTKGLKGETGMAEVMTKTVLELFEKDSFVHPTHTNTKNKIQASTCKMKCFPDPLCEYSEATSLHVLPTNTSSLPPQQEPLLQSVELFVFKILTKFSPSRLSNTIARVQKVPRRKFYNIKNEVTQEKQTLWILYFLHKCKTTTIQRYKVIDKVTTLNSQPETLPHPRQPTLCQLRLAWPQEVYSQLPPVGMSVRHGMPEVKVSQSCSKDTPRPQEESPPRMKLKQDIQALRTWPFLHKYKMCRTIPIQMSKVFTFNSQPGTLPLSNKPPQRLTWPQGIHPQSLQLPLVELYGSMKHTMLEVKTLAKVSPSCPKHTPLPQEGSPNSRKSRQDMQALRTYFFLELYKMCRTVAIQRCKVITLNSQPETLPHPRQPTLCQPRLVWPQEVYSQLPPVGMSVRHSMPEMKVLAKLSQPCSKDTPRPPEESPPRTKLKQGIHALRTWPFLHKYKMCRTIPIQRCKDFTFNSQPGTLPLSNKPPQRLTWPQSIHPQSLQLSPVELYGSMKYTMLEVKTLAKVSPSCPRHTPLPQEESPNRRKSNIVKQDMQALRTLFFLQLYKMCRTVAIQRCKVITLNSQPETLPHPRQPTLCQPRLAWPQEVYSQLPPVGMSVRHGMPEVKVSQSCSKDTPRPQEESPPRTKLKQGIQALRTWPFLHKYKMCRTIPIQRSKVFTFNSQPGTLPLSNKLPQRLTWPQSIHPQSLQLPPVELYGSIKHTMLEVKTLAKVSPSCPKHTPSPQEGSPNSKKSNIVRQDMQALRTYFFLELYKMCRTVAIQRCKVITLNSQPETLPHPRQPTPCQLRLTWPQEVYSQLPPVGMSVRHGMPEVKVSQSCSKDTPRPQEESPPRMKLKQGIQTLRTWPFLHKYKMCRTIPIQRCKVFTFNSQPGTLPLSNKPPQRLTWPQGIHPHSLQLPPVELYGNMKCTMLEVKTLAKVSPSCPKHTPSPQEESPNRRKSNIVRQDLQALRTYFFLQLSKMCRTVAIQRCKVFTLNSQPETLPHPRQPTLCQQRLTWPQGINPQSFQLPLVEMYGILATSMKHTMLKVKKTSTYTFTTHELSLWQCRNFPDSFFEYSLQTLIERFMKEDYEVLENVVLSDFQNSSKSLLIIQGKFLQLRSTEVKDQKVLCCSASQSSNSNEVAIRIAFTKSYEATSMISADKQNQQICFSNIYHHFCYAPVFQSGNPSNELSSLLQPFVLCSTPLQIVALKDVFLTMAAVVFTQNGIILKQLHQKKSWDPEVFVLSTCQPFPGHSSSPVHASLVQARLVSLQLLVDKQRSPPNSSLFLLAAATDMSQTLYQHTIRSQYELYCSRIPIIPSSRRPSLTEMLTPTKPLTGTQKHLFPQRLLQGLPVLRRENQPISPSRPVPHIPLFPQPPHSPSMKKPPSLRGEIRASCQLSDIPKQLSNTPYFDAVSDLIEASKQHSVWELKDGVYLKFFRDHRGQCRQWTTGRKKQWINLTRKPSLIKNKTKRNPVDVGVYPARKDGMGMKCSKVCSSSQNNTKPCLSPNPMHLSLSAENNEHWLADLVSVASLFLHMRTLCLPLDLTKAVKVVSSPQSEKSSTGYRGSGSSGSEGTHNGTSGGEPTAKSGKGATYKSPGGGGKKDDDDNWDRRGGPGDRESEEGEEEEEEENTKTEEEVYEETKCETEWRTGTKPGTEDLTRPGHVPVDSNYHLYCNEKNHYPQRISGHLVTELSRGPKVYHKNENANKLYVNNSAGSPLSTVILDSQLETSKNCPTSMSPTTAYPNNTIEDFEVIAFPTGELHAPITDFKVDIKPFKCNEDSFEDILKQKDGTISDGQTVLPVEENTKGSSQCVVNTPLTHTITSRNPIPTIPESRCNETTIQSECATVEGCSADCDGDTDLVNCHNSKLLTRTNKRGGGIEGIYNGHFWQHFPLPPAHISVFPFTTKSCDQHTSSSSDESIYCDSPEYGTPNTLYNPTRTDEISAEVGEEVNTPRPPVTGQQQSKNDELEEAIQASEDIPAEPPTMVTHLKPAKVVETQVSHTETHETQCNHGRMDDVDAEEGQENNAPRFPVAGQHQSERGNDELEEAIQASEDASSTMMTQLQPATRVETQVSPTAIPETQYNHGRTDDVDADEGEEDNAPRLPVAGQHQSERGNDELEEAIQASEDIPAAPHTMVTHLKHATRVRNQVNRAATTCILTPEDIEKMFPCQPQNSLGLAFSRMPSCEGPRILETDDSSTTTPIQESPFQVQCRKMHSNITIVYFTSPEPSRFVFLYYFAQTIGILIFHF